MERENARNGAECCNVPKAVKKRTRRGGKNSKWKKQSENSTTQPVNSVPNSVSRDILLENSIFASDYFLHKALNNQLILPSTSTDFFISQPNFPFSPPRVLENPKKTKVEKSKIPKNLEVYNCLTFKNRKRSGKNVWKPPTVAKTIEKIDVEHTDTTPPNFIFHFKRNKNFKSGFFIRKRSTANKHISANIPVLTISNFTMRTVYNTIEILNRTFESLSLFNNMLSHKPNSEESTSPTEEIEKQQETLKENEEIPNGKSVNKKLSKKEKRTRSRKTKQVKKDGEFCNYQEYAIEDEIKQGLEDGTLIRGFIRINIRNNKDAYVTNKIKGDTDYYINSVYDQNRALDGDEVILRVKPDNEWEEGRKTAKVVFISKMVHNRTSIGKLSPIPKNENFAHFLPRDRRFPTLRIPIINCPPNFLKNPRKFANNLFVAKLIEWKSTDCGEGLIVENVGVIDDLTAENRAILKTYGLDHEPFDPEVLKSLPRFGNEKFPPEWLEGREDLRNECIFTIDPMTARDLDDAVSCKVLDDGNLEIGVHIADVSHFLKEDTELDKLVQQRATSVYMVDRVHHMLPVELCMNCSLLPAMEKLAFSVFWKMTPDAQILEKRFAKTVIKSCAQLAYQHAQQIIENPKNTANFPQIKNGFDVARVTASIMKLFEISQILRRRRFENGALRINQIKISFDLDAKTGAPISFHAENLVEANNLIEEFMLLANISVAEKLVEDFEEIAFLRRHEAPKATMLNELKMTLESVGMHVVVATAKSIQTSLAKYASDDLSGRVRGAVMSHLFAKPMIRAVYFCSGLEMNENYGHFALNIPLYTHFTSPIRRYADIMVHRLLAASIGLSEKPNWDPSYVGNVAEICNTNKYNAKKAQEDSTKLYFGIFLMKHGPLITDAAVVDVRERAFDVLVLNCGEIVRIYLGNLEGCRQELEEIPCIDLNVERKEHQRKNWRIKISFFPVKKLPSVEIMIELFALVKIELTRCPKKRKIVGNLIRPSK